MGDGRTRSIGPTVSLQHKSITAGIRRTMPDSSGLPSKCRSGAPDNDRSIPQRGPASGTRERPKCAEPTQPAALDVIHRSMRTPSSAKSMFRVMRSRTVDTTSSFEVSTVWPLSSRNTNDASTAICFCRPPTDGCGRVTRGGPRPWRRAWDRRRRRRHFAEAVRQRLRAGCGRGGRRRDRPPGGGSTFPAQRRAASPPCASK